MKIILFVTCLLVPTFSHAVLIYDFSGLIDESFYNLDPSNEVGGTFRGSVEVEEPPLDINFSQEQIISYWVRGRFLLYAGNLTIDRPLGLPYLFQTRPDRATLEITQSPYVGLDRQTDVYLNVRLTDPNNRLRSLAPYETQEPYKGLWMESRNNQPVTLVRGPITSFTLRDEDIPEAPVPEPATMLLSALGLGVFGLLKRRRG